LRDKINPHVYLVSKEMPIGENLKRIRAQRNMTQGQLADDCELSVNQISRIERGSAKPELETIKKLCRSLKCTSDELIFDEDEFLLADEMRAIFKAVEDMPEEKQEMVMEFLEAVVMKSDMEKWMYRTERNAKAEYVHEYANKNSESCEKCGGKMNEEKATKEKKENGVIEIRKCEDCGNIEVFTAT